jgi:heterodisulfide reductase subunit C
MTDFGYTINKSHRIDLDANSTLLAEKVRLSEPSFKACIGCGSCTGTCTAGRFTQLNLRKMQLLLARGETAYIQQELEKCMLCGKCMLVCPRGVNTRNVILEMLRVLSNHND